MRLVKYIYYSHRTPGVQAFDRVLDELVVECHRPQLAKKSARNRRCRIMDQPSNEFGKGVPWLGGWSLEGFVDLFGVFRNIPRNHSTNEFPLRLVVVGKISGCDPACRRNGANRKCGISRRGQHALRR